MKRKINITPVTANSPNEIHAIASSFYQSSRLLGIIGGEFWNLESIHQDEIDKKIKTRYALPKIILRALAVEIALKAYTFQDGFVCKGHNLYQIFTYIKKEKQNEIRNMTIHNMQKIYPNRKYDKKNFEADLSSISTVFSDWRYLYEKKEYELDYEFLDALASSLF